MNSTNSIIITLKNVGCRYRVKQGFFRFKNYDALKDVSFSLYQGEVLGVIGRNGAGKSTLLRLLRGIILPDRGVIWKKPGISISLLSIAAGFYPELSGKENVILTGMLMGMGKKKILERLEEITAFAELEAFIHDPVKTYSSGMRARLGFAIALELSPDVLLVDEALGVGDDAFKKKAVAAMEKKFFSGISVVFVSHNMPTVYKLCKRVLWLEDGKTKMEGPAKKVIRAYLERLGVHRRRLKKGESRRSARGDTSF
ncbi:O-antigen export system ATP-binding protein RfbB [Candidatus Desulfarcum epimagneticum]|uniref:O-antigen export system ATP-binding protein RfbB n=1 Tax=uncultured Desulfobacteraceae bacterium TaxID=218296 RepID=A0A484HF62_9BACT|nr:O-antigen export system ATP-binding protein RfbB [uncultured Desulfobacteraceae bacterium]